MIVVVSCDLTTLLRSNPVEAANGVPPFTILGSVLLGNNRPEGRAFAPQAVKGKVQEGGSPFCTFPLAIDEGEMTGRIVPHSVLDLSATS